MVVHSLVIDPEMGICLTKCTSMTSICWFPTEQNMSYTSYHWKIKILCSATEQLKYPHHIFQQPEPQSTNDVMEVNATWICTLLLLSFCITYLKSTPVFSTLPTTPIKCKWLVATVFLSCQMGRTPLSETMWTDSPKFDNL